MRLQRIYASKLYVTSTRKDRIHAAIQDPLNVELVQQLSDYLDEDAKIILKQAQGNLDKQESGTSGSGSSDAEESKDNSSISSEGSNGSFTRPSFSGSPIDDFGDDDLADIDLPDESGDSGETSEPEAVESVTQEGKKITAACQIWNTLDDVVDDCETIKGTLNAREDTKGVTRLQVVEHELWIYYNDDSNLNDKMIEVISVLNSTGYTYLKFNRLARSNNAIVFDILLNDTEPIKTVKEIEEEKK